MLVGFYFLNRLRDLYVTPARLPSEYAMGQAGPLVLLGVMIWRHLRNLGTPVDQKA
jgi:hypothetical protein